MIDKFHVYMKTDKDPLCRVGDVVIIDTLDCIGIDMKSCEDGYKAIPWKMMDGVLYGIVDKIIERDDDDYYVNGRLLNFEPEEKSPSFFSAGSPYTSSDNITLSYSERTSAMFNKVSKINAQKLKFAFPHRFL